MKVLLVKPLALSDHIQPPLGLGYLAESIKDAHAVEIIDCLKQQIDCESLCRHIEQCQPDVVGFQTYTYDVKFVREASRKIKKMHPEIIILVGGPHPSCVPTTIFTTFPDLDFGFAGEAENGLRKFLDGADHDNIPGLIYRKNDQVVCNDPELKMNLDDLGMPAWELLKPENYPEAQHGFFYKKFPIAPILITRGCPYQCTFCAGNLISGHRVRKRSIPHVINEILYLYHDRGIREFHIIDDNFTINAEYAKEFLRELKKQQLDISWATPNGVRMNTLDEELLNLMKETGLYLISLGIESGSDRVLSSMKKELNVEQIHHYVSMIHRSGIDIAGFFIMGFPGETEAEIRQTIELAVSLPIIRANFFTYLPFPGTETYRELEANGKLGAVDWENFYFMSAAYVPETLTRKQLKYLQRLAFVRFYLRPGIFFKTLGGIRSLRHLLFFIKRFYHWLIMS